MSMLGIKWKLHGTGKSIKPGHVVAPDERLAWPLTIGVGMQHVVAMFGATFLVTAPLTVVFVSESFGARHLGALTGLITMVHQVCGGVGAYLGAAVFDHSGSYDVAFAIMGAVSLVAVVLTLILRRPTKAGTHE